MAGIVFVESAADDLLHLAVVQIDAWAEERFATCVRVLRHGVRVVEVDSQEETGRNTQRHQVALRHLAQISISDLSTVQGSPTPPEAATACSFEI